MEITALSFMSILYLFSFLPSSVGKYLILGKNWVAGNRSLKEGQQEFHLMDNWGARCERAYLNLQTNYPPFAVAICLIIFLEIATPTTGILAFLYLIFRLAHFTSYAFGIVSTRAFFWAGAWLINLYFYILILLGLS